jgi:hypothetical protein
VRNRVTRSLLVPLLLNRLRRALGPNTYFTGGDVAPLLGRPGWLWLRVRGTRVIFRPLTAAELVQLGATVPFGFLVARIVTEAELARELAQGGELY